MMQLKQAELEASSSQLLSIPSLVSIRWWSRKGRLGTEKTFGIICAKWLPSDHFLFPLQGIVQIIEETWGCILAFQENIFPRKFITIFLKIALYRIISNLPLLVHDLPPKLLCLQQVWWQKGKLSPKQPMLPKFRHVPLTTLKHTNIEKSSQTVK